MCYSRCRVSEDENISAWFNIVGTSIGPASWKWSLLLLQHPASRVLPICVHIPLHVLLCVKVGYRAGSEAWSALNNSALLYRVRSFCTVTCSMLLCLSVDMTFPKNDNCFNLFIHCFLFTDLFFVPLPRSVYFPWQDIRKRYECTLYEISQHAPGLQNPGF